MPDVKFCVPYSDMRWRNTKDDPPEGDTHILGLFLFWDSTNHTMHETVHQCLFCDGHGWSIILGYSDGPDGCECCDKSCCPPAFWADLRFNDHPTSPHGLNASLN